MPSTASDATPDPTAAPTAGQRLLDAEVRFHLGRLGGDRLEATVAALAADVLDAADQHPLADLVDAEAIKDVVARALVTVPGSAAVGGIVELATAVALDGPTGEVPLGELVAREQVETLVDELLGLHPVLERGLERLTASPLVGVAASRFMGRIVTEVVQANKAVADRVPGLGSLVSLGTNAASRVVGAADKQLEGLLGDTMGRGGTYAVRRLNRILVDTVRDPTTRDAVMQVWDLAAASPARGVGGQVRREELAGVVGAVHDLAVSTLAHEQVREISGVVVEAFFERFGGYTPAELLDELDLARDDVVADAVRIAPGVVEALRDSGDLERLLRTWLGPFWESDEARAALADL